MSSSKVNSGKNSRKFLRGFRRFFSKKINRILIILVAVFITLAGIFYFMAGNRAEASLIEQMLHRQSVLVRAGARELEEYFLARERELLFIASLPSIQDPKSDSTREVLEEATEKLSGPVVDIIRVDKEGIVVARGSGVSGEVDVSDRGYFIWGKDPVNRGQVYYTKVLVARGGPAKGKMVIAITSPVWKQNNFTGLVLETVSLDKLGEEFVLGLKVTERSSPFLVESDGDILATIFPELVGKNILDYVKNNPWEESATFLKVLDRILAGEDGKGVYVFNEPQRGPVERLVAFAPVSLAGGQQIWSLGLAVPKDDALAFFGPFYGNQTGALIFIILTILAFSAFLIFAVRIARRNSYLEGFTQGRNNRNKH